MLKRKGLKKADRSEVEREAKEIEDMIDKSESEPITIPTFIFLFIGLFYHYFDRNKNYALILNDCLLKHWINTYAIPMFY